MELIAFKKPTDIPIWASNLQAVYIMGDVSGVGFGFCFWMQGGTIIDTKYGR